MLSERAFRVSQPAGAAARGVPPRDGHQFKEGAGTVCADAPQSEPPLCRLCQQTFLPNVQMQGQKASLGPCSPHRQRRQENQYGKGGQQDEQRAPELPLQAPPRPQRHRRQDRARSHRQTLQEKSLARRQDRQRHRVRVLLRREQSARNRPQLLPRSRRRPGGAARRGLGGRGDAGRGGAAAGSRQQGRQGQAHSSPPLQTLPQAPPPGPPRAHPVEEEGWPQPEAPSLCSPRLAG
mmetsp:Transcript_58607/g.138014  ORF Transcript_58607/g.138014 Transcript_58607/m.138014 type:complete len:236 (+) Transcript_58607:216-923(+)